MKSIIILSTFFFLGLTVFFPKSSQAAAMRTAVNQQQISSSIHSSLDGEGLSLLQKRTAKKKASKVDKHASIAKGFTFLSYPLLVLSPMLIGVGLAPFLFFAVLGAIASLIAFGFGYSTWKKLKASKKERPKLKRIARFAMLTPFLGFLLILGLTFLNFSNGNF
ncbi:MAG: hypothetical protein AAF587_03575 [Bacteroidota bacterium]